MSKPNNLPAGEPSTRPQSNAGTTRLLCVLSRRPKRLSHPANP